MTIYQVWAKDRNDVWEPRSYVASFQHEADAERYALQVSDDETEFFVRKENLL